MDGMNSIGDRVMKWGSDWALDPSSSASYGAQHPGLLLAGCPPCFTLGLSSLRLSRGIL